MAMAMPGAPCLGKTGGFKTNDQALVYADNFTHRRLLNELRHRPIAVDRGAATSLSRVETVASKRRALSP